MQVMPDLGGRLAQSLAYPVWDPVLLYQPDVSLQLGAFHLQELTGRYAQPVHVLAAYNAGASRVERWSQRIGVDDPEVFTERIPFAETRGLRPRHPAQPGHLPQPLRVGGTGALRLAPEAAIS